MNNKQKGFGMFALLWIMLALGIISWIGYTVYNGTRTKIHNAPAVITTLKPPQSSQPIDSLHVSSLAPISTADWRVFREDDGRISYDYPPNWTFKNSGLIYYGSSQATSKQKSAIQTLVSPDGDSQGDYDYNYKKLAGAKITITASSHVTADNTTSPADYCSTLKSQKFFIEEIPNDATPICVGMTESGSFYHAGASYCGLTFQLAITFGGKNTTQQAQADIQTMIALVKTWNFKNACTTDSNNVEHVYFGP